MDVRVVRPNTRLIAWLRQATAETAWGTAPACYRGSVRRSAGAGILSLEGATRVRAQFYASDDSTLAFEVAGLSQATGGDDPQGQLLASGTVTFDAATALTGHPITGAGGTWRPGITLDETSGLGLAKVLCNQATSLGIAAWLELDRIEDFDALAVHFHGPQTGDGLVIASVR